MLWFNLLKKVQFAEHPTNMKNPLLHQISLRNTYLHFWVIQFHLMSFDLYIINFCLKNSDATEAKKKAYSHSICLFFSSLWFVHPESPFSQICSRSPVRGYVPPGFQIIFTGTHNPHKRRMLLMVRINERKEAATTDEQKKKRTRKNIKIKIQNRIEEGEDEKKKGKGEETWKLKWSMLIAFWYFNLSLFLLVLYVHVHSVVSCQH